jgi:hypothetical protein
VLLPERKGQCWHEDRATLYKRRIYAMKLLRPSVIASHEWYKERDQDEWRRTKQAVLVRNRSTCTYCGLVARKFHQVNHIGAEDDHHLKNLETVCRACHTVLHMGISSMQGTLTVFECKPEVSNIAPIVCVTRALVAKKTSWPDIEQHILDRFARPGGKHYPPNESIGWANRMIASIRPPEVRGYLPEGLAVLFHATETWNGYPEAISMWQCLPGSGYRKEKTDAATTEHG